MFLDGVTYAAIARNLAEGRGRFWEPFYTATIYPAFHEHPPLAFWLQSLWFRAMGDHWYVERAYAAGAAVLIAWLIAFIWRAIHEQPANAWLPIALWLLVPVVSWTLVGNLLEVTVCVFVTAAVAAITAASHGPNAAAIFGGVLSGFCVVGAVLSKGPVGLFPLAAPFIVAIVPDRRRHVVRIAVGQWLTVAVCATALFSLPDAHESLSKYIDQQVMTSLTGHREVSGSSVTIVIELLRGVWLPMMLGGAAIVAGARGWTPASPRDRRVAFAFTLMGLAGTLPMLVSPKQAGHYLMPAVPFYAIGAAALLSPSMTSLAARVSSSRAAGALRIVAVALVAGAIAAMWVPAIARDPARLIDLDRLASAAPIGATVGLCPSANGDWLLHAWMQRRFHVSLDATNPGGHQWFLKSASRGPECPPATCEPASDPTRELVLMRCR